MTPLKTEELKLSDEWEIMNSLHDSFNEIVYVKFIIDTLKDLVERKNIDGISDAVDALESFYPVYCNSYDTSFLKAWNLVIKSLDG